MNIEGQSLKIIEIFQYLVIDFLGISNPHIDLKMCILAQMHNSSQPISFADSWKLGWRKRPAPSKMCVGPTKNDV